jgi:hypothetical protein
MLSNAFFNLTESKKLPVVRIDKEFGGVCVTFTDNAGDELRIVLSPETLAGIVGWCQEFMEKAAEEKL